MKKYLICQFSIGVCAALFLEWYSSSLPTVVNPLLVITTIEQDLKSTWPGVVVGICWSAFSYLLTRRIFSNQVASNELSDVKKGSESDKAFGFGIIMNVLAILLYMLFRNVILSNQL